MLKKRTISLALSLCLLLCLAPMAFAASPASDAQVLATVQRYVAAGLLESADANAAMTRAQFAVLMNNILDATEQSSGMGAFADITEADAHYGDMAAALAVGYMQEPVTAP